MSRRRRQKCPRAARWAPAACPGARPATPWRPAGYTARADARTGNQTRRRRAAAVPHRGATQTATLAPTRSTIMNRAPPLASGGPARPAGRAGHPRPAGAARRWRTVRWRAQPPRAHTFEREKIRCTPIAEEHAAGFNILADSSIAGLVRYATLTERKCRATQMVKTPRRRHASGCFAAAVRRISQSAGRRRRPSPGGL